MKIAVSATGNSLDSSIDERFGRCRYFILVDTTDMSYEAFENTNAELSSSAGIQSAGFVASKDAAAVITGNCGPKAMQVFAETKTDVILGQHGSVKDAIARFKEGKLQASTQGNVPGKTGVATPSMQGGFQPGMGGGMGMGGGRGMGGCGRGMGMGGGRGMGGRCGGYNDLGAPVYTSSNRSAPNQEQDLALLQRQAEDLKRQLDEIQTRIKALE